jgi:hypothetical protein
MNVFITSMTLCVVGFLLLGCRKPDISSKLIGTWDCTNITRFQHRARDDAKTTLVFREDGKCISYDSRIDGTRHAEYTNDFRCVGNLLWRDMDTNVIYRVALRHNKLVMTLVSSNNKEDVGLKIIYERK